LKAFEEQQVEYEDRDYKIIYFVKKQGQPFAVVVPMWKRAGGKKRFNEREG